MNGKIYRLELSEVTCDDVTFCSLELRADSLKVYSENPHLIASVTMYSEDENTDNIYQDLITMVARRLLPDKTLIFQPNEVIRREYLT